MFSVIIIYRQCSNRFDPGLNCSITTQDHSLLNVVDQSFWRNYPGKVKSRSNIVESGVQETDNDFEPAIEGDSRSNRDLDIVHKVKGKQSVAEIDAIVHY